MKKEKEDFLLNKSQLESHFLNLACRPKGFTRESWDVIIIIFLVLLL